MPQLSALRSYQLQWRFILDNLMATLETLIFSGQSTRNQIVCQLSAEHSNDISRRNFLAGDAESDSVFCYSAELKVLCSCTAHGAAGQVICGERSRKQTKANHSRIRPGLRGEEEERWPSSFSWAKSWWGERIGNRIFSEIFSVYSVLFIRETL